MINSKNQTPTAAAIFAAALALMAVSGGGCSSTLETGYAPRKLGASDEMRRGYYAQPFTPEAKAARDYEEAFGDSKRPKPGY